MSVQSALTTLQNRLINIRYFTSTVLAKLAEIAV